MDIRELDDRALVARAAQGDELAAAEIYDRCSTTVLRSLVFFVGEVQAAEDAMQEALLYFFRHIQEYDADKSSLRVWLMRIAHNYARNEHRRRKRKPFMSLDTPVTTTGGESRPLRELIAAPQASGDGSLGEDMLARLAQLNGDDREVLVLRYIDGHAPAEIAEILDIKPRSVSMRLWRALKRLRRDMGIQDSNVDEPPRAVQ